jgi:hypothetical protein
LFGKKIYDIYIKAMKSPILDKVETKLRQQYPSLIIERTDVSLHVPATNDRGFPVELTDAGQEIVPDLGGWIAYGLDADRAIPLFQAGVIGTARVREVRRGSVIYKWIAEILRDGKWIPESPYLHLSNPFMFFWRKHESLKWNDPARLNKITKI